MALRGFDEADVKVPMPRAAWFMVPLQQLVAVDGECWIWLGASFDGRAIIYKLGTHPAARFILEQIHGKQPKHMQVNHTCDNAMCVRPAHLYFGTRRDNRLDMFQTQEERNARVA